MPYSSNRSMRVRKRKTTQKKMRRKQMSRKTKKLDGNIDLAKGINQRSECSVKHK